MCYSAAEIAGLIQRWLMDQSGKVGGFPGVRNKSPMADLPLTELVIGDDQHAYYTKQYFGPIQIDLRLLCACLFNVHAL